MRKVFRFFSRRPHLHSKFVKSVNMIKKCFKKIRLSNNAEFHADFESVDKFAKNHAKKVVKEKVQKIGV
jgi:hypothetical protein